MLLDKPQRSSANRSACFRSSRMYGHMDFHKKANDALRIDSRILLVLVSQLLRSTLHQTDLCAHFLVPQQFNLRNTKIDAIGAIDFNDTSLVPLDRNASTSADQPSTSPSRSHPI